LVTIIRVSVVNDHMLLMFISVSQIDARSYWCAMQEESRVTNISEVDPDGGDQGHF
jgi:hypothetical protein